MKKRLLLQLLAVCMTVGAYAYNAGDYIYSKTGKYKTTGNNLVVTGNFEAANGWKNELGNDLSSDIWSVEPGKGPNGETALMSLDGGSVGTDVSVTNSWTVSTAGIYVISYKVKGPDDASTTTSSVAAGNANYIDFFVNATGAADKTDARQVAEAVKYGAEWTEITDTVELHVGDYLVFVASKLSAGTLLTDFGLNQVVAVYDTRIAERRIAFAKKLLDDPNFNVEAAAEEHANLADVIIPAVEGQIAANQVDDPDVAAGLMAAFEEGLTSYLDATTVNLATEELFKYVSDVADLPKYNRGQIKSGQQIGGFLFRGDNWQHGVYRDANNNIIQGPEGKTGLPYLQKAIQAGQNGPGPGSVALANKSLPAGKYYISAEMMNAAMDGKYNTSFDLECAVKAFVGTDSVDLGTIKGEEYVKFYAVATLENGQDFEAGFWWDGPTTGAQFNITRFEVRSFGDIADAAAHKEAWDAFKAQWSAATDNRAKLESLIGDKNLPWGQDSLKAAQNQWDPYYQEIVNKGWVNADGNDAGVASTDEMNEWAEHQGFYPTVEEGEDSTFYNRYVKYAVVRGYQDAANYVTNLNKPLADLAEAIKNAENELNDDKNTNGDKVGLQLAINDGKDTLADILENTTDATREADVETVNFVINMLANAVIDFLESAKLEPFVDIDFSNNFEAVEEDGTVTGYVIKGAAGQMEFVATNVTANNDDVSPAWNAGYTYEKGFKASEDTERLLIDVLRIGKSEATVNIEEPFTDNDVLRVSFDAYVGNLSKGNLGIDLRNEANERVAGFCLNRYDGAVSYNDFNNDANTGLDLLKYVTGYGAKTVNDDGIYNEKNKSVFELIVDFKAQTVQGIVNNATNGSCTGEVLPLPASVTDSKVKKFVLYSNYNNSTRRSWFDNLKMYKYASSAEGPIVDAIQQVAVPAVSNTIYTLSGVQVKKASKPGLYIINGKKAVIK